MSDQHDHLVADILDFGATAARAAGEMLGGPWGTIAGKGAAELLNVAANTLRRGVATSHIVAELKKLKPLDYQTSRAESDARAAALPEKP